jgi:hypothetical protein
MVLFILFLITYYFYNAKFVLTDVRHLLTYVDPLTGSQRSEKRLQERLGSSSTPATSLPAIRAMLHYSPFFHADPKAAKKYDKALVHHLAVFQAVFRSLIRRVLQFLESWLWIILVLITVPVRNKI